MFKKLICWLFDHKWRRLHKGEDVPFCYEQGQDAQLRICNRCGESRVAKKRQRKGVQQ